MRGIRHAEGRCHIGLSRRGVEAMITIHGVSADTIRRNLDDRYRAATEDQRERGLKWYLDARGVVWAQIGEVWTPRNTWQAAAHEKVRRFAVGCEVLALLSPRCPWEVNIEAFRRVASGEFDCPDQCIPRQFARAARHWESGEEPPTTPKCRSFADSVYYGGLCRSVCLDTHALNAALGRTATQQGLNRHFANTRRGTEHPEGLGAYDALAEIYTNQADKEGLAPAQYQAVIWLVQREGYRNV